jgi:hypothetical protein
MNLVVVREASGNIRNSLSSKVIKTRKSNGRRGVRLTGSSKYHEPQWEDLVCACVSGIDR